jgi:hypothetical protein
MNRSDPMLRAVLETNPAAAHHPQRSFYGSAFSEPVLRCLAAGFEATVRGLVMPQSIG